MKAYPFPHLTDMNEVRDVITRQNERLQTKAFIEADKGSYVIFNYIVSVDQSFPEPWTADEQLNREYAILRECRGITFDPVSRKVIRRPYHKFFNIGQKAETAPQFINLAKNHRVMEKLDGCLTEDAILLTPYGYMSMKDICETEREIPVWGYDHTTKKEVWAQILGHSIKTQADNWYRISLEDGTIIELTGNHQVWCSNKNQYLTIDDLEEGDEVRMAKEK